MSFIRAGLEWLRAQQHAHLTDPVTLARGGDSVEVWAMVGSETKMNADLRGATTEYTQLSFIIAIEDYTVSDVAVKPAIGDTIVSDSKTYTVNRTNGGDGCWRYNDQTQLAYRVYVDLTGDT